MTPTVKITAIGNSLGIILPDDVLKKLGVRKGDTVYLTELLNGIQISACNLDVLASMEQVMAEHRDVLKNLAES
jgi:putative addiction module antidote